VGLNRAVRPDFVELPGSSVQLDPPSRAGRLVHVLRSAAAAVSRHRTGLELVLAVVVVGTGVALRFSAPSDLWLDEALTVDISRLPVGDLLEALRHEAHPPLYYLLLHAWMSVFGQGDVAVRSLSSVLAVLALPFAWRAGHHLAGRAGALAALLLLASSPFAIRYASEGRMYSLVALLVLMGWLAVRRALERPSTGRLVAVAVVTAALLLTHYWATYLLAASGLALAWRWWCSAGQDRRDPTRVLLAVVAGALATLPWAASVYADQSQVETTFGPARPGTLLAGLLVGVPSGEALLFGMAIVVLIVLALFARPTGHTRVELELVTRSPVALDTAVILLTIAFAALGGLSLGASGEARHTTVALPLVLLVAAYGATRLPSWWLRTCVVGGVALCGIVGALANVGDARTQAGEVAREVRASVRPGDLVVYCPDQLGPSVSRLLPGDVRSRAFPESDLAPERVEWANYSERVERTDPIAFARAVSDDAGRGTLWLAWYGGAPMVGGRCEAVARELERLRPGSDSSVTTPSESQETWFERAWLARFPGS
jgi:mannosyltransferase